MKNISLRIIVGLLALLNLTMPDASAASSLDPKETADLFRRGNELFHQANDIEPQDPDKARDLYQQSVMHLERLAEQGSIHNGKLYYNIANTYFKMHDLGRAILNYRRAETLMPNDPNLRQNLAFARSKCLDKIPEKQEKKVLQTLFFWHYDLATRTRTLLLALAFPAFWVLLAIRLFIKKPSLNWACIASGALALVLLASLGLEIWTRSQNTPGVILAPEVTARKGDSETYQPSFNEPLHAGTEFVLREDRGRWYYIELPDGRSCWVPAKSASLIK